MSYTLSNGTRLEGIDGEQVLMALSTLRFWGGADEDSARPEDAMARALHAVVCLGEHRARMDRESQRYHEGSAMRLRVDSELRRMREREQQRADELEMSEFAGDRNWGWR